MNAIDYSYHKVTEVRRAHRIWIENQLLTRAGFKAGASYIRKISDKEIQLVLTTEQSKDSRTVSQTTGGTPIIDLCNKTISAVFGKHERVLVEYRQGVLTIRLHHICSLSDERVKRFNDHLQQGYLDEGTFCVGVGMATLGIHEGFKRQGISIATRWVLDRDARFLDAAIKNNPVINHKTSVVCGKMEEVESRLFCPVDILQFSMSCKVHTRGSRAKVKREVAEDHADAAGIYGVLKVIEPVNPAVIISENVREAKNSATFLILKTILDELGYKVYELDLGNSHSGSFEKRDRYWLVAIDKNLPDIVPEALPVYAKNFATFGDVVNSLPVQDHVWKLPTDKRIEKIARDKAKGNGFSDTPQLTNSSTHSPCIRAEYTKAGSCDVQVAGDNGTFRMLSPQEHCLMKSAPLYLIDGLFPTLAHYVLGQGVDMGQAIGVSELVALCILGKVQPMPMCANQDQFDLFSS